MIPFSKSHPASRIVASSYGSASTREETEIREREENMYTAIGIITFMLSMACYLLARHAHLKIQEENSNKDVDLISQSGKMLGMRLNDLRTAIQAKDEDAKEYCLFIGSIVFSVGIVSMDLIIDIIKTGGNV